MLANLKKFVERKAHGVVRAAIMDWPLDFGLETAVLNGVQGDYHEFGVFKGRSFIRCAGNFMRLLPSEEQKKINFWAYDSFEGLPETKDSFAPAHFSKGSFSASQDVFLANVVASGVPADRIKTVAGFYDQSLTEEVALKAFSERKAAMIYIDCDVYESAVPIFSYITSGLQVGTVLVVDDWVRHHAHPGHGIQRAFYEWLESNSQIKVTQIALTKRIAFVVNKA